MRQMELAGYGAAPAAPLAPLASAIHDGPVTAAVKQTFVSAGGRFSSGG